jgi:MFS family permease
MVVFITVFANFAGSYYLEKGILGPRTILGIGAVVGIGGCFLSSLTTNWTIFRIFFPLTYGFAVGFTYMVHLYLAWKFFPGKEGILSGIVNAAFGGGGFLFTYLSSVIVNPTDEEPRELPEKPFTEEIAGRLPSMLREFCLIWTILFVISFFTTLTPKLENSSKVNS